MYVCGQIIGESRVHVQGITGYRAIARALNARGIETANGRQWYATTVKNVLSREHGTISEPLPQDV